MSKHEVVKDLEYWARQAAARTERRRIRREIAPHLNNLYRVNDQHNLPYVKGAADAIDRATKAPKRKATKGGMTTVAVDTVSVDMRPLDRR